MDTRKRLGRIRLETQHDHRRRVGGARKTTIAERFGVEQLALFGSAARDELRADSDVDVLVQFTGVSTFGGISASRTLSKRCPAGPWTS